MEFQPLEDGKWRVFITPQELTKILKSVPHRRCRIAILLMCLSLRRTPASEVVPNDFLQKNGVWWVEVEGKGSTDRHHETMTRKVWVPYPIWKEIESFIEERGIGDNDPLVDVGNRQVNNWVDDACENAVVRTGFDGYLRISPHDFRRFFATHFLLRLQVDPQTVRQLGGWKKVEHMFEYLLLPTDLMKRRLAEAGLLNTNPLGLPGEKSAETIEGNVDTIRKVIEDTNDPKVVRTLQDELIALSDDIPSLNVTVNQSNTSSHPNNNKDSRQSSLSQLSKNSERGVTRSAPVAKAAYMVMLVTVSWSVTFGVV